MRAVDLGTIPTSSLAMMVIRLVSIDIRIFLQAPEIPSCDSRKHQLTSKPDCL